MKRKLARKFFLALGSGCLSALLLPAAGSEKEEALAYGFVTHNEPWGADHIAHESSLTSRFKTFTLITGVESAGTTRASCSAGDTTPPMVCTRSRDTWP